MKKYMRPELSISKFDVEEIMAKSGVLADVTEFQGNYVTEAGGTTEATFNHDKAVYFNWE